MGSRNDSPELHRVAQTVVRRAQRQAYVVRREVRQELTHAGLEEDHWKGVLALARPALVYRHGRYYYTPAAVARLRARVREEQRRGREVRREVQRLVAHGLADAAADRRRCPRVPFVRPVKVLTADGCELDFVSLDVSQAGIRLLGPCSLVNQKVRVSVPRPGGGISCLSVGVLWAARLNHDWFQQGGVFLGALHDPS